MNAIELILEKCKPHLLEQSIEFYLDKIQKSHGMLPMTKEEREVYAVEGWEELSNAVFFLLHSGFDYSAETYLKAYKINRLDGFENIGQLVHFAEFIIDRHGNFILEQLSHFDALIEKAKSLTETERLKNYTKLKELAQLSRTDLEIKVKFDTLQCSLYDHLESWFEAIVSLWIYIQPIFDALNNIDAETLKFIRENFDIAKEMAIIE